MVNVLKAGKGVSQPDVGRVPAVNVVVVNDAGEILLIRRTDNGNWALPGDAIDLGESVAQAAVRETLE
jgi:ADP-ribose pyrophosphatase YjhB (NUDIX family)